MAEVQIYSQFSSFSSDFSHLLFSKISLVQVIVETVHLVSFWLIQVNSEDPDYTLVFGALSK